MSFRKGVESSSVLCARYGVSSSGLAPVVVGGGRIGEGEKTAAVVSAVSKSRIVSSEAGLSQAGGWMFARRWRLRRRASQRGRGVGKGGLSGCVGPWWDWRVSQSVLGGNGLAPLLALLTSGLEAGVLATHSQELEGFEALARDHRHLLHFAEEADFVGREPGGKREGHVLCICYGIACVASCCCMRAVEYRLYYSRIAVSRGTRLPRDKVEIDGLKRSRIGRGDIRLLLKRHLQSIPFLCADTAMH